MTTWFSRDFSGYLVQAASLLWGLPTQTLYSREGWSPGCRDRRRLAIPRGDPKTGRWVWTPGHLCGWASRKSRLPLVLIGTNLLDCRVWGSFVIIIPSYPGTQPSLLLGWGLSTTGDRSSVWELLSHCPFVERPQFSSYGLAPLI